MSYTIEISPTEYARGDTHPPLSVDIYNNGEAIPPNDIVQLQLELLDTQRHTVMAKRADLSDDAFTIPLRSADLDVSSGVYDVRVRATIDGQGRVSIPTTRSDRVYLTIW